MNGIFLSIIEYSTSSNYTLLYHTHVHSFTLHFMECHRCAHIFIVLYVLHTFPSWRKDLQEEVMNDVKQEPNDDVEEELIDRDTRGSDKDLQEEVMNDVKQEPNDDVEEELIDRDTIGSDKFYMRPPHPWRLTYDYDTHTQSYWHPGTQESSMNPPPGSLPVVRLPEKGTIVGAATRMRDIVISAVSSRSKSIKFSMGYGPRT
jgi:hypothetical protein